MACVMEMEERVVLHSAEVPVASPSGPPPGPRPCLALFRNLPIGAGRMSRVTQLYRNSGASRFTDRDIYEERLGTTLRGRNGLLWCALCIRMGRTGRMQYKDVCVL